MTPDEALAQLRSLHFPVTEAGEMEFPLWLAPLSAVLVTCAFCLWRQAARKKRWLRQAQAELNAIARDAITDHADRGWQRLAILLRRLTILHAPADDSASVTGIAWLALLDRTFGVAFFRSGYGRQLVFRPYQDKPVKNDPELASLCDSIRQALKELEHRSSLINENRPAQPNKQQASPGN